MGKFLSYLPAALLVLVCICGCGRDGRMIPKSTLAHLYADMLMADEWLRVNPDARKMADTTLFFEPIFNRYGYTKKDYVHTMTAYTQDPDALAKVLRRTTAILERKKEEAVELKDLIEKVNEANAMFERGYEQREFEDRYDAWEKALWAGRLKGDVPRTGFCVLKGTWALNDISALKNSRPGIEHKLFDLSQEKRIR